jgi:hypothetical protein
MPARGKTCRECSPFTVDDLREGKIDDQGESVFRLRNFNIVGFYYLFNCATCFGHTTIFEHTYFHRTYSIFFIYNLNRQSEFRFYKLMLWLLHCLDGESSGGESPVPQIRSIGQFLLSRLFSSLTSSVMRSGFSWISSVVWCLLHFWWMTSCTYDMPRLEIYHGASTIILRILDWLLWIIDMLDLLAQPHNSRHTSK